MADDKLLEEIQKLMQLVTNLPQGPIRDVANTLSHALVAVHSELEALKLKKG